LIEYARDHTMEELLREALDKIDEIAESPIGFYHFVETDTKSHSLRQWSSGTLAEFRRVEGARAAIWTECLREKRPVIQNDYGTPEIREPMAEGHSGIFRQLVVPVIRADRIVVILGVGNKLVDYTAKDAETLTYLGDVTWEIIERKRDEEKVRQNEITLRTLLDQLPSGVTVREVSTGALIFANLKGREIAGPLAGDAAQFSRYRFFYPDGRQYQVEEWPFSRSITRGEAVEAEEFEYERDDGVRLSISMNCAPIRDSQGQIIMGACVFNDITERRRAEQRLRDSEALLAESQKIGHLGCWSFDLRTNRFTCSDELYRIAGFEPGELDATHEAFLDAVHPDDRKAVDIAFAESLRRKEAPFDIEYRIVRKHTGEVRYVQAKWAHQRDAGGTVFRSIGMLLDITERKMAEGALREHEELLDLFIKHAPASIAMLDREMRYLGCSQRWRLDHNLGDRDLAGLSHYEVFPEIPERWKEVNRRALAGEVLKSDSDVFKRADGSVRSVRWEVRPWRNTGGDVAGILILSEDITELTKRAEELSRVNRALRALSNAVQSIIHAVDESELLNSVCRIMVEDCGYYMGWIGFAEDDENRSVTAVAQAGFEEGYLKTIKVSWADTELGRGPTGTAIRTGIPTVCNNILTEARMLPWREEAVRRGYGSSLALPLNTGGRTLGAITIYSKEPDAFSESERALLVRLADELAYGISALRLRHAHGLSEKNLRESEARLDLALRSAGMGTWHWDIDENRRYFDDQACFLLGIDPKTFTGQEEEFFGKLHPEDVKRVKRALSRTLKKNVPYGPVYRVNGADGEVRYVSSRGKLVRDDNGRPVRLNGLLWDITERFRMIGELRKSRDDLELRVKERTAALELVNEKLRMVPSMLIEAQEKERKRLAAEMHDSIGQTIAALKFRIEHVLGTLEKRDYNRALELLHEFVPVLQRSIDETRAIYMGLRPMILSEYGIMATLEWYRQELLKLYPNQHIELESSIREEDIPDELKTVIFRIVQEALNNAFKHAGPEWIDVRLALNGDAVELEVSDDGIGMDLEHILESPTAKSLGLIGMRERAEITGGRFTIGSVPGKGTTVKAVWRIYEKSSSLKHRPH
jgi:PAS domain S-box-containing protein